jgi:hypothetical protein
MFAQFASNFQSRRQIVDLYLPYWYLKLLVLITLFTTKRIIYALFLFGLAHHVIRV